MHLTPFTVNFVLLVFGLVIGAYLPLALFYLVGFFRRQQLGFILIWRVAVRLAAIVLLFILVSAALGFMLKFKESDVAFPFLGAGFFGGLLVGIILFVIGLIRSRRRVSAGTAV